MKIGVRRGRPASRRREAVIGVVALVSFLCHQAGTGLPAAAATQSVRIAGADRFETAAAVSAATFAPNVQIVFLATGENFPDALAGTSGAAFWHSPILLVGRQTLPRATRDEVVRLNPQRVVVLGGEASISREVSDEVSRLTQAAVVRVAGADRYSTAAEISKATYMSGANAVYVANGESFADALSGGPAAAASNAPVLLVTPNSIPSATSSELRRLGPQQIVVLGGDGAVGAAVAAELGSFAPVTRIAGVDRYATAAAVSAATFATGRARAFIATGVAFPDALAAGSAAADSGAPILLTQRTCTPKTVRDELERLAPDEVVILGGEAAIAAGALETTCAGRDAFAISDVPFQAGTLSPTYNAAGPPQVAAAGRFQATATYSSIGIQVARREGAGAWQVLPVIHDGSDYLNGMDVTADGVVVVVHDDGAETTARWFDGGHWSQQIVAPSGLVRIAGDIYLWSQPDGQPAGNWEVASWNGAGFGQAHPLLDTLPGDGNVLDASRYIYKWKDTPGGAVFLMREYEAEGDTGETRSSLRVVELGPGATVLVNREVEHRVVTGTSRVFSTGTGLAVGRNGEIAVVWADRDPYGFPYNPAVLLRYALRGRDGAWTSELALTTERADSTSVLAAGVADDGSAYALWAAPSSCGNYCIYGAQVTPTAVHHFGSKLDSISIAEVVPAANGVHVLWASLEGPCSPQACPGPGVYRAVSISPAGWGEARQLATQPTGFNHFVVRDGLWAVNIDPNHPRVVVASRELGPI